MVCNCKCHWNSFNELLSIEVFSYSWMKYYINKNEMHWFVAAQLEAAHRKSFRYMSTYWRSRGYSEELWWIGIGKHHRVREFFRWIKVFNLISLLDTCYRLVLETVCKKRDWCVVVPANQTVVSTENGSINLVYIVSCLFSGTYPMIGEVCLCTLQHERKWYIFFF